MTHPQLNSIHRLRRHQLLAHREELATAAVEHLGHDLPGADVLFRAVHLVEELIRVEFPATWQEYYADWISRDADRLHDADTPRPSDRTFVEDVWRAWWEDSAVGR
jgi:hypothetical protein